MSETGLAVAFVHRDLGIGGGERLVIDAARALQRAGHRVTLFVGHHDPGHSFEEARDGTLDVRVCPTMFPGHLFQRGRIPCNVARMWALAAGAALRGRFDLVFCDLIPHAIPALRLFSRAKILYYCHYPDRRIGETLSLPRRLYRAPLDGLEAMGLRLADRILVNSRFTGAQFRRAYPALGDVATEVLYPGVDARVEENAEVLQELQERARILGIADRVIFQPSCSEAERLRLLSTCRCLVYTSDEEHFGYGLVEAMAARRPGVAVKSGGPLEIVVH